MSLPFLDAMMPAFVKAQGMPQPKRMGVVYFPNGYIKDQWAPKTAGAGYELTRALQPLAAMRDKFNIVSGLACDPAKTLGGFHDRAVASFMTGVEMVRGDVKEGISVDQLAAQELGRDVPFSSLEISIEEPSGWGGPCFRSATNRLPFETNPRYLFERLFGDADRLDPIAMAEMRERQRSILDSVGSDASRLKRSLGASDQVKVDEYLDSIRDIERRLAVMDDWAAKEINLARPTGTPDAYADHVNLMIDLQVVALQTDMTRVWTFMLGDEASNMTFNEIGLPSGHHGMSHHGHNPEDMEEIAKVNTYQVQLFSRLVEKMDSIEEQDGTLLDNTLLMYGSSLGDGHRHMQVDLPILIFGGKSMGVKGGRHLVYPDNTPITNLYLTMLDKIGAPVENMGDSTGQLRELSDV